MGYNTSVIVMNGALDAIEQDQLFGKKLANAVQQAHRGQHERYHLDVSAGGHLNAATVIETHHADEWDWDLMLRKRGAIEYCRTISGWLLKEQA